MKRWELPRWLKFPARKIPAPQPGVLGEVGGVLGVARRVALTLITLVIMAADGAAFAESYRGLYMWATHHTLAGFWAAAFPLQVDAFIVAGEAVVFLATVDGWKFRHRLGAWSTSLIGLGVSVAGNIGHVAAHDVQSRGTAAVPPIAAFAALWLGMSVVKRLLERRARATVMVGQQEIPADKVHAARMAFTASHAAGNPISQNQLITRFGLGRPAAQQIRREVMGS